MARPPHRRSTARSVVYLDPAPRGAFDTGTSRRRGWISATRRSCRTCCAIMAGTTVDFPNNDHTYHNVFSLSKTQVVRSRPLRGRATRSPIRFDRPGIVRVFCDIHSHMSAFILVFAHRYFAVTDDEGRYRHRQRAARHLHRRWRGTKACRSTPRRVAIPEAGGDVELDFTLGRDERLLVADQPDLPGQRAAGGPVHRRRGLPRQRRRHGAGRERAAARARGSRHAARGVPQHAVRTLHPRGAAHRRPAEAEGGDGHEAIPRRSQPIAEDYQRAD